MSTGTSLDLGSLLVMAEQRALKAALDVYETDPFPDKPAAWEALLDGALADFFGPRELYSLSYFLTSAVKQWEARIAACRELAAQVRALRGGHAVPVPLEGGIVDAVAGKLARGDTTPLDPAAADPVQLWRYAFARAKFRGDPSLLPVAEARLRAAGLPVPHDPREAA